MAAFSRPLVAMAAVMLAAVPCVSQPRADSAGKPGGALVLAAPAEPKTLNPLLAADQPSRDVIFALSADLVHINRGTLRTEPALAERCVASKDGRHFTVTLRPGLHFSDGHVLTADDVIFSFRLYLDPVLNSSQRDLLVMDGKPITVTKASETVVQFDLPAPYAPGDRLFDSFWILPRHKLEKAYQEGRLAQMWGAGTAPADLAGAGPFRLREFKPGERVILERNPYYWKKDDKGQALPYLERLEFVITPRQDAQLLRLISGEVDALARVRPEDLIEIRARRDQLTVYDAGPGLEYNFLALNWNAPGAAGEWFRDLAFRRALNFAVDRVSMTQLVYRGMATPLATHVTPGNREWISGRIGPSPFDPETATMWLNRGGYQRNGRGPLKDAKGHNVEFSVMVSASSQVRQKMATLLQEDLAQLGIKVNVTPVEFASMVDAVMNTRKFEAALWGLASGDTDPNSEINVWQARGPLHVWNMASKGGAVPALYEWEVEVDKLMQAQMTQADPKQRKAIYDRLQQAVLVNQPLTFLVSPHIISAAKKSLSNFQPAVLEPVVLWNCDRIFWSQARR